LFTIGFEAEILTDLTILTAFVLAVLTGLTVLTAFVLAVLTGLTVLTVVVLAVLTGLTVLTVAPAVLSFPDLVKTAYGTKLLLGCGCLNGGSENSGGKRLAISMVEEAWLSEKKRCDRKTKSVFVEEKECFIKDKECFHQRERMFLSKIKNVFIEEKECFVEEKECFGERERMFSSKRNGERFN
ncbi:hypothetical protein Tco_0810952, partial [Tanacetum coccineum]